MGYNQQPAFQQQLPSFQEMMNEYFGRLHSDMNNKFKIQQEYNENMIEKVIEKINELSKEMNDSKKDSEPLTKMFVPTITFESFKIDLHNATTKYWATQLRDISHNIYSKYWYQFLFITLFYSNLFNIFI